MASPGARELDTTPGLRHVRSGLSAEQESTTSGGSRITERSCAYRTDGCLEGIEDSGKGSRRFDLDVQGRVTAVHAAGWSERYAYDSAGNRTEAAWPAKHPGHEALGSREYTGTWLIRAGRVHYEYGARGRVVVRRKVRLSRKPDVRRYEWDAEDRLSAVTPPDGIRWCYTYDPLGRRTGRLRLGTDGKTFLERTVFTWDGNALCEQTIEHGGKGENTTLTWDHDGLSPLSQAERRWAAEAPQETIDERFFAIVTDLVGTPTELVSPDGEVAWHTRSTLWGTTAWNRDASAYTPLRFSGQYHDPETGPHYSHHRHYGPETARHTSPDPLGLLPAPNPVTYVHNPTAGPTRWARAVVPCARWRYRKPRRPWSSSRSRATEGCRHVEQGERTTTQRSRKGRRLSWKRELG